MSGEPRELQALIRTPDNNLPHVRHGGVCWLWATLFQRGDHNEWVIYLSDEDDYEIEKSYTDYVEAITEWIVLCDSRGVGIVELFERGFRGH